MGRNTGPIRVDPEFYNLVMKEYEKMKKSSMFPEDVSIPKVTRIMAIKLKMEEAKNKKKGGKKEPTIPLGFGYFKIN